MRPSGPPPPGCHDEQLPYRRGDETRSREEGEEEAAPVACRSRHRGPATRSGARSDHLGTRHVGQSTEREDELAGPLGPARASPEPPSSQETRTRADNHGADQ